MRARGQGADIALAGAYKVVVIWETRTMTRDEIIHYTAMERLRDQRKVKIRAIRPDDKGLVIDALQRVSPESLYYRLFAPKKVFTDEDLKQYIEVDSVDVVALVAVLEEGENQKIVGGGRYVRCGPSETGQRAEVAFLIDDAHQGLGIGSRLFKHLVAIALASGITTFEAEVLPSNSKMLRVFERSGFQVAKTLTRDSTHVTIELARENAQVRVPAGPEGMNEIGGKP
jgi:RimJ/RimL family protein N-acetyltransferase